MPSMTLVATLITALLIARALGEIDFQYVLTREGDAAQTCDALLSRFPEQTYFAGGDKYENLQWSYWIEQQSELRPSCRFQPLNSFDVLHALSVVVKHNTSLAIVSGGHSSNKGASSIHSGVAIDLGLLNEVTLSPNRQQVWVGPGARWGDVYKALEPHGLTVAGGRLSHVGVGGLVLGGGVSWFANQIGFVCDAVTEFEVVTPGLRILRAAPSENGDLFWALKGSLGAFGIVTRIKMPTIANSGIFGGGISFHADHLPQAFKLLQQTASNADLDLHTQAYISFAYLESISDLVHAGYVVNTAADNNTTNMQAWSRFPSTHSSLRHTTIANSAEEITYGNDPGMRRSKLTFTVTMDVKLMVTLYLLIRESISDIPFDRDSLFGVTYQPLTLPMMQSNPRSSGGIFSETFSGVNQPLLLISVELWWQDGESDEEMEAWLRSLHRRLSRYAEVSGVVHPWKYPNYAAHYQQPFGVDELGKNTVDRLRSVRKETDPEDVWQWLVPGIFQI